MQHKVREMGSQTDSHERVSETVLLNSKLITKDFTATLTDVRVNLLTLVLIIEPGGAA